MVNKHCAYGLCRSDSRYAHRDFMKNVFWIPVVRPWENLQKSKRWARACGRGDGFTELNVTRFTYICTLHFVGGAGPTSEHPDPIPANYTAEQVSVDHHLFPENFNYLLVWLIHISDIRVGAGGICLLSRNNKITYQCANRPDLSYTET